MSLDPIALVALAILGLAVGSFLNVCIHRLPRKGSIVQPASSCPHCGYVLRWSDNIPVLSYAMLGGRCRSCKAGISVRYPIVELLTMVVFVAHYLAFGLDIILVPRLLFGVRAHRALRHRPRTSSPAERDYPARYRGWPGVQRHAASRAVDAMIGVLAGGGVLWLVGEAYYRYSGQEGMGGGDVKMLAMIGAFLGWKLMVLTLVLSSVLGSVVGILVIVLKRGGMKHALPYGTFLSLAALVSSLFGRRILDWYLGFYR